MQNSSVYLKSKHRLNLTQFSLVALSRLNQNCAAGGSTPYGGPPSYCRNPLSIGDSHPLPSEGSPASAAPSPMQPSSVSQPTSVPSGDQVKCTLFTFLRLSYLFSPISAHNHVTPSTRIEQSAQCSTRHALLGPPGQEHTCADPYGSA